MKVAYARISSGSSSLDGQIDRLKKAGAEKIFSEVKSGKDAASRPVLQDLLDFVRENDVIYITKIDRLARSVEDLLSILKMLEAKKVSLICLDQALDTSTPVGRLMIQTLGVVAEFERSLVNERCAVGRKKALENGVKFGRPQVSSDKQKDEMKSLYAEGMRVVDIAKKFKVSVPSVYRFIR